MQFYSFYLFFQFVSILSRVLFLKRHIFQAAASDACQYKQQPEDTEKKERIKILKCYIHFKQALCQKEIHRIVQ